ncbi:hypothetical protein QVD17_14627 [Tagetes erecta]|uniref:Expansin-like EG45 domain-containing protein n=1 Tax=Tagetes erecta TaxID=13708 RepID=A0AAD8KMT3_TARER|nr:hypothetical protein QVD17_14627 [Tagetes erecta]
MERNKYLVIIIMIMFHVFVTAGVKADVGTATSYDPPYTPTKCNGNEAGQFPSGNLFISVSEGLWDNGAACGRRYRLKCLSGNRKPCKDGTIDVRVVDRCSKTPCPSTILLSNDAFSAISKTQTPKINIEYVQI